MSTNSKRRFLKTLGVLTAGVAAGSIFTACDPDEDPVPADLTREEIEGRIDVLRAAGYTVDIAKIGEERIQYLCESRRSYESPKSLSFYTGDEAFVAFLGNAVPEDSDLDSNTGMRAKIVGEAYRVRNENDPYQNERLYGLVEITVQEVAGEDICINHPPKYGADVPTDIQNTFLKAADGVATDKVIWKTQLALDITYFEEVLKAGDPFRDDMLQAIEEMRSERGFVIGPDLDSSPAPSHIIGYVRGEQTKPAPVFD